MTNPSSAGTASCPLFYLLVNRYFSGDWCGQFFCLTLVLRAAGADSPLGWSSTCLVSSCARQPLGFMADAKSQKITENHRKSGSSVLLSLPLTRFRVLAIGEDTNQGTKEDNLSRWVAVAPFSSLGLPGHSSPSHLWKSYKECPNSVFSSVCCRV